MTIEDLPPWRPLKSRAAKCYDSTKRCSDHELSFSGRSLKQMEAAEQKVLLVVFCKEDKSVLYRTAHTGAKNTGREAAERKQW